MVTVKTDLAASAFGMGPSRNADPASLRCIDWMTGYMTASEAVEPIAHVVTYSLVFERSVPRGDA